MKRVYLDHNSTTPLRPEVEELWRECVARRLGNPSSLHAEGRAARDLVDRARERVAAALDVREDEVVFTSGGTESNNLALLGAVAASPERRVVTSAVEHSSVLDVVDGLARRGHPTRVLSVDACGAIAEEALEEALEAPGGVLVSLQTANNEVGTLQPVATLVERARARGEVLVHTDAVQALGRVEPPVVEGVDLASFSAHKVGGPVGVGVLVVRGGTHPEPVFRGGGQEGGLRPGTENAAAIAAAGLAFELARRDAAAFRERARALAGALWTQLRSAVPDARLLGPPLEDARRLPNTLSVLIPGTDGKVLVTALDVAGLSVSAGSACASGSVEPSHVLTALGCTRDEARAGLRLSLGADTTREDCAHAVDTLRKIVDASRASRGSLGAL